MLSLRSEVKYFAMTLFGRGHEICQLLIAFLLCMPLAGQGATTSPNTMTTVSSNASNGTTSSSKVGYIVHILFRSRPH